MLVKKFNIDIDKIKKRNTELINLNLTDKLNTKQQQILNWRKGEPTPYMNKNGLFGYYDLSNYLINTDKFGEIELKYLRDYLITYEIKPEYNISYELDLKNILLKINSYRVKAIQKYIKLEDSIFSKGIHSSDIIYRIQREQIEGNMIMNSTSWALSPMEGFCNKICHLYITKIPKFLKVFYLENKSNSKHLKMFKDFQIYEFEYLLPRGLEFTEIKTKKYKLLKNYIMFKDETLNYEYRTIYCHWIKIIKKVKPLFPQIATTKLII